MSCRNRRGSIAVTALWGVSFFSILAGSLAFHARQEILLTRRETAIVQDEVDFASALNRVADSIMNDPEPYEDSADKPWYGDVSMPDPLGQRVAVRVEDEESRLDLNHASATCLSSFFKRFEDGVSRLEGPVKKYPQFILKLRNEKRLESLEELLLIEEFRPADLERLRPYLTVHPERAFLNINTASPLVLGALVESLSADHFFKRMLTERLEELRSAGTVWRSEDLVPQALVERLKIPKTPLALQAVQELASVVTTDSETFRITIRSTGGAEATGVFAMRQGQVRPDIREWQES